MNGNEQNCRIEAGKQNSTWRRLTVPENSRHPLASVLLCTPLPLSITCFLQLLHQITSHLILKAFQDPTQIPLTLPGQQTDLLAPMICAHNPGSGGWGWIAQEDSKAWEWPLLLTPSGPSSQVTTARDPAPKATVGCLGGHQLSLCLTLKKSKIRIQSS